MPTTVTTDRLSAPAAALRPQERQVLSAVGCGLRDDEIAAALALPEDAVAEHLAGILRKLGLRDRTAAVVHAFDCGLVVPGRGPRTRHTRPVRGAAAARAAEPRVRISLLGPLRAWRDGRPLDLGHLRQQAVLAALALGAGRPLSMEELVAGIAKAARAGGPHETVRLCARALELFREEPLAGLPGPLAELERLRLTERRIAIARRKVQGLLRLGRDTEAIAELFSLSAAHPLDEPLAAMLMHALQRNGRQADALTVFERARRCLADDLGVSPSRMLRETHRMILRGDEAGPGTLPPAGSVTGA